MTFDLTDDQRLIGESAARFVADFGRNPPEASGFDWPLWKQIAEMGWLAASLPQSAGGIGGPIEAALIAEALGRGSIGGDLLGAAVLGPQLLVASGGLSDRPELLDQIISGEIVVAAAVSEPQSRGDLTRVETAAVADGDRYRLRGTKTLVLAGDAADMLIVSAAIEADSKSTIGLFLVAARQDGVDRLATPLVDGTSAATIAFDGAIAERLGEPDQALAALAAMAEHGMSWIVAETVGMVAAVGEITADYCRTRQQFGMALGQFQVLQHKLADMEIDRQGARAAQLVALAAFALPEGDLRRRRFSGAKASAGEALRRVAGAGVQTHGGMGMTIEYPVGRYLQRMVVLDAILGSPDHHLRVCADLLAAA
ncbi:MAG: acyl-CoA dehydrogenase family protein [Sphingomonadales bacterium]